MPLTKTTAAQTEDALSYYRVRGLYFLAVVFFGDYSIVMLMITILILLLTKLSADYIPLNKTDNANSLTAIYLFRKLDQ